MSTKQSISRKKIGSLAERVVDQVQALLAERGPLIRGSFGTRSRKCGNPGCRCARGELHVSKFLNASEDGTVRQVHVPATDELMVAEGVERYRRFQKRRQQLAAVAKELLELLDELGLSLLMPYPPDRPLPPPKRRGRRSKADDAQG